MILELADIRIKSGQQEAFEKAIALGIQSVISRAKGFQGAKVNRGVESPDRYILQIFWDTLFAAAPAVEHFELAFKS